MLLLHVASMRDPRGFGLRSDVIDKTLHFRADIELRRPGAMSEDAVAETQACAT
jgi:hypothetical protein